MLRIVPDRVAFALLSYRPFLDILPETCHPSLECPHWSPSFNSIRFITHHESNANLLTRRYERFIPLLSISFHFAFLALLTTDTFIL